jgi:hypothetical protein
VLVGQVTAERGRLDGVPSEGVGGGQGVAGVEDIGEGEKMVSTGRGCELCVAKMSLDGWSLLSPANGLCCASSSAGRPGAGPQVAVHEPVEVPGECFGAPARYANGSDDMSETRRAGGVERPASSSAGVGRSPVADEFAVGPTVPECRVRQACAESPGQRSRSHTRGGRG